MTPYQAQWEQLHSAWKQDRIPQAMLFVGALDSALKELMTQFMMLVFCKNKDNQPCHVCPDCLMTVRGEHPDMELIKPEKSSGPIKIDQIRELQNKSYLTPQRAAHRFIVIEAADRMNTAAANALLKVLEEPAPHTVFLLTAPQLSTVLPTILSRCQLFRFCSPINHSTTNLFTIGTQYPPDSEQAILINQSENILENLVAVIEKRIHPCAIAAQWSKFELNILLWFLYLVYSQILRVIIHKKLESATEQFSKLAKLLNATVIFAQIDKINALQRKLSHNMNVNHTLVLEDLLLAL